MKIGAPVPSVSTIYNTQGMQGLDYYKDYPIDFGCTARTA